MHFQRQKLMAVTEYIAPRPAVPERCLPAKRKAEKEEEEEVTLGRPRSCGLHAVGPVQAQRCPPGAGPWRSRGRFLSAGVRLRPAAPAAGGGGVPGQPDGRSVSVQLHARGGHGADEALPAEAQY